MLEILKRTVFAGIGAAVITKERVESILGEWVEQGKLTRDEASKMACRIAEEGKKEFERTRDEVARNMQSLLGKVKYTSETEFEKLEARVRALEEAGKEGKAGKSKSSGSSGT